jgi:ferredoxin
VERTPYRIDTDRERCMGTGQCTVQAPGTFDVDDDAKVVVIDPAGDDLAAIRRAVTSCPTGTLYLVEEDEHE